MPISLVPTNCPRAIAPDFWCPLRGHQTAGAHAGTNGHHRAHKWPNMGTMLIQPMSGQWCPRVGTGGLEPTSGHHGAHGGLKMCSAHGTLRGHHHCRRVDCWHHQCLRPPKRKFSCSLHVLLPNFSLKCRAKCRAVGVTTSLKKRTLLCPLSCFPL